jgi:NAD+ kinase
MSGKANLTALCRLSVRRRGTSAAAANSVELTASGARRHFYARIQPMNRGFASIRSPRTIALVGKYHSLEIAESLRRLAEYLHERGVSVFIERETAEHIGRKVDLSRWVTCGFNDIGAHADIAIVLGGDGTMLNAARRLARYCVPLVGVNQGRLGFMTDIALGDMLTCMDDLLDGRFTPENRMLLAAEVLRDGKEIASNLALNDVVVDKGAIGRMIEFELFIDGEFIFNLRSDGMVVSTPTGSTAYSMSAGGPIIHPTLAGIALVPLCPHALTNRPIIVNENADIELRIANADDPRVHFDGQVTVDLERDDCVRLRRSEHAICFLHPPGYSYFAMLRQKLHWSERPKGP